MWARVARFDGDPADVQQRIAAVQGVLDDLPPAMEGARLLLLVDRESAACSASRCSRRRRRCAAATS